MRWTEEIAKVTRVGRWQDKTTGEPKACVDLQYFGGKVSATCTPEDAQRFAELDGHKVTAAGQIDITENKFGTRVYITVDELISID